MRTRQFLSLLFISLLLFTFTRGSCQTSTDSSFKSGSDKVSYAFGVNIGENLGKMLEKRGLDMDSIDPQLIAQGIIHQMKNDKNARVHKDSVKQVIRSYFKMVREQTRKNNQKKGKAFLKKERQKDGVEQTSSGLTYEVKKEGSGPKPDKWDSVRVHYRGTKIDGSGFDSTMPPKEPVKFSVQGRIVKGWTEALQKMKEGAEWRIMLPSDLAYGSRGRGEKVEPGETLVFHMELKEVIEVDSAEAAKNRSKGKGMSPAMKRKLKKKMRQKRRRKGKGDQ